VTLLGLVNRESEAEDRVVIRVRLVVRRDPRSMTWDGDGTIMAARRVHIDQR
jgi:hypothetical protein